MTGPAAWLTPAVIDAAIEQVCEAVRRAEVVVPVGGRTHWEVGGPPPRGTEVTAPAGIVDYDPAELTVTVGAGTRVGDLDATLAASGQQCPLDPRDPRATVGGVLASGCSGLRRLRYGPVRNRLLEVHVVTGDGRRIKGGGRTVKNVSGYDVARLLVGSLGTLGVIVQVTLRCEPEAPARAWLVTSLSSAEVLRRAFRPAAVLVTPDATFVLLEGHAADIAAETERLGADLLAAAPELPDGPCRGRIAVRPRMVETLCRSLHAEGIRALGEAGVGTIHVAADTVSRLRTARTLAHAAGGWMLRERGGVPSADSLHAQDVIDGFGVPLPNAAVMARIKAAFDPLGKCNPGRLPIEAEPLVDVESLAWGRPSS